MLNPNQYDRGPAIKVAALRVGDKVWHDWTPKVIREICESDHNWFRLTFDGGSNLSMAGNHTLERAELRMVPDYKARTVNVVELAKENEAQRELIVDLRTEAILFENTAEGLQQDVDALEKELRWRDAKIHEVEKQRKYQFNQAETFLNRVGELEEQHQQDLARCKELERQVRTGDKRIRCQQDEIEELEENLLLIRAQLEAIISGS